jgi:hypothetical protein
MAEMSECGHEWVFLRTTGKQEKRPCVGSVTKVCKDGKTRKYGGRVMFKLVDVMHDIYYCRKCLEYRKVEAK